MLVSFKMLSELARRGGGGGGRRIRSAMTTITPTTIHPRRRLITYSRNDEPYFSTLQNLHIGAHTRVIVQGFTGRNATSNSQESIAWGTNIVGGVVPARKPGTPDTHLDRPLFPSVRAAMDAVRPSATAVYVPAPLAAAAIEEALEAEVPLIVAVAEHIPLHDMLRVHAMLRTQHRSRLVGPNSPGILNVSAHNRCRIGFQPLPVYSPGLVGIVAKSGTLSYETAASTTRAGLGQSLCVGVGGDVLPGTDLEEALAAVVADPGTRAVALVGEMGGDAEVRAADWIEAYYRDGGRTPGVERKPIAFLLAGFDAPRDRVMGHAGAFWQPGDPTIEDKNKALLRAGATPVQHPSEFGPTLARLLGGGTGRSSLSSGLASGTTSSFQQQTRKFHLDTKTAMRIWTNEEKSEEEGLPSSISFAKPCYLALGIDRHTRDLCIRTCSAWSPTAPASDYVKIPWPPGSSQRNGGGGPPSPTSRIDSDPSLVQTVLYGSGWDFMMARAQVQQLDKILCQMAHIFEKYEAKSVTVTFLPPLLPPQLNPAETRLQYKSTGGSQDNEHSLNVLDLSIDLDDAAYRSGSGGGGKGRIRFPPSQYTTYAALQATTIRDEGARAADAHGLVYHRLAPLDPTRHVGIVVNGAGLAMNTVDELQRHGLPAANFLDTGGLATSATVHKAMEILLRDDERVRVMFVNIFGGLTEGAMIARGILQALEALIHPSPEAGGKGPEVEVPVVVVRIQGTGEEEGRRLLREEGGRRFPGRLFTYADFGEALDKVASVVKEFKAPAESEPSKNFKRTWS